MISFDEVVISLFITGPRLKTLPVEIFDYVESRTDPMTAAVSVMLIVATLFVVFLVERTLGIPGAWQMNVILHRPFQWSSSPNGKHRVVDVAAASWLP